MKINALLTEVGVPMGERGNETVVTAVDVNPDMTVRELLEATCGENVTVFDRLGDKTKFRPDPFKSITLRVGRSVGGGS